MVTFASGENTLLIRRVRNRGETWVQTSVKFTWQGVL